MQTDAFLFLRRDPLDGLRRGLKGGFEECRPQVDLAERVERHPLEVRAGLRARNAVAAVFQIGVRGVHGKIRADFVQALALRAAREEALADPERPAGRDVGGERLVQRAGEGVLGGFIDGHTASGQVKVRRAAV